MGEHDDIDHSGVTGAGIAASLVTAKGDLIAATGSGAVDNLAVGANDTILMADSAQATGLKWVASATPTTQDYDDVAAAGTADTFARGDHLHGMPAAGGGGFTQSFLGYNTAGGTSDTTTSKQFMKAVTPGSNGQIVSIGGYMQGNGAQVWDVMVAVMDNNAGAPGKVLALGRGAVFATTTFRWVDVALSYFAASGTQIWLAFACYNASGNFSLNYDGSGTDYTKATGQYIDEINTNNSTVRKYSIRAGFLA